MTGTISRPVSSASIAEQYLAFFRARGHVEMPGSALVVPGSSTSFVIAGMQPLLPYLRGAEVPPASRLTALQRCLRTVDVEDLGLNGRNLTLFQMLGNWSIADYGKREAIEMARDFLLHVLNLNWETLWVTTFAGDPASGLSPDDVAVAEWQRVGMPSERLVPLGVDDNLWTMGGPGPCGPCTEIFVDRGEALGCGQPTCRPGCACERFLEIWNLVFMEFERLPDGGLERLPFLSIDTGMGLERIATILQGAESGFSIDLFLPARRSLAEQAPPCVAGGGPLEERARRMIVDHTRAALFVGLAGVVPGREGRGSVLRRLIRRAARQCRLLGIQRPFLGELVMPLVESHRELLTPEERELAPTLVGVITDEEERFAHVLTQSLRYLAQLQPDSRGLIPGTILFDLHASRGFPSDLAAEILAERGLSVDWSTYDHALAEHREVSRASVERRFHSTLPL